MKGAENARATRGLRPTRREEDSLDGFAGNHRHITNLLERIAVESSGRIASYRALDAITHGDKERYLSLYAQNGVIHDPVGMTAIDLNGAGHRGLDALSTFWDESIAKTGELSFLVHQSHAIDDQVANSFTIIPRDTGKFIPMDCIFIYRVNHAGLLVYEGGYWEDPDRLAS